MDLTSHGWKLQFRHRTSDYRRQIFLDGKLDIEGSHTFLSFHLCATSGYFLPLV